VKKLLSQSGSGEIDEIMQWPSEDEAEVEPPATAALTTTAAAEAAAQAGFAALVAARGDLLAARADAARGDDDEAATVEEAERAFAAAARASPALAAAQAAALERGAAPAAVAAPLTAAAPSTPAAPPAPPATPPRSSAGVAFRPTPRGRKNPKPPAALAARPGGFAGPGRPLLVSPSAALSSEEEAAGEGGLDEDALLEAQAVSSAVAQAHAAAREMAGSETHSSFAGGLGVRRSSSSSLLAASGAVARALPRGLLVFRRRWLAVLLPLLLALWAVLPPDLKLHAAALLAPFVTDNAFTAPAAAATAQKVIAQSFGGGPHPWAGRVAVVTGCTAGGLGAETAAVLAGVGGLQVGRK
jgi:hypothetical protein